MHKTQANRVLLNQYFSQTFFLRNQEEAVLQQTTDEKYETVSDTEQSQSTCMGRIISDLDVRRTVVEFGDTLLQVLIRVLY